MLFSRISQFKWSIGSVLLVSLVVIYFFTKITGAIDSIKYALTPPELPQYAPLDVDYLNDSGWPNESSEWFHYASQGTATIPVPYNWLVALEAPKSKPWLLFFGKEDDFVAEYMPRLGFIPQQSSSENPQGLPIGIAKTQSIYFEGIDRKATAAGFTCAACHTGQMTYENKRYIVDGAPATTDLGLFTRSLGAALGQTLLSSKVNILDGRFDRFARKVLGSNDNILTRNALKENLDKTLTLLGKNSDTINVTEGFSRLDALNRIGNQVFDEDMARRSNYSAINAPVNYPHIWTTSWFDWVQYDGSIMQPLTRNAGEALGVASYVDTSGPDKQRFASSVDYANLVRMEKWIGGTHPLQSKQFNGLLAPKWPDEFPAINRQVANEGKNLYRRLCQGCHLPTIDNDAFWTPEHWQKISYIQSNGTSAKTDAAYINLNIIELGIIGTDPAQAMVLQTRTVDTTGLNLNDEVCTWVDKPASGKSWLTYVPLEDSATSNFGLALGAFVQRTNQQWFKQNYISPDIQNNMEGQRPNCLQVGKGYKARPLNGVWATAPFLHNGSVANLYDLLSTERPTFVELGNQGFDAVKVGIVQSLRVGKFTERYEDESYKLTPDYSDGHFMLDTRQPGNTNIGHWFDDKTSGKNGIVGPKLAENEKLALLEYLKTL